jgi:hypothetical protein
MDITKYITKNPHNEQTKTSYFAYCIRFARSDHLLVH